MRLLGAILAGGQSRRFGSDKALALVDGVPMLAQVCAALRPQVDTVVICGGQRNGVPAIPDCPPGGIGPLGGINAAFLHAIAHGYDAVVTVPVDTIPVPHDLVSRLGHGPAAFAGQFLIGIWPVKCQAELAELIRSGGRSVKSFMARCDCRLVSETGLDLRNINRPDSV